MEKLKGSQLTDKQHESLMNLISWINGAFTVSDVDKTAMIVKRVVHDLLFASFINPEEAREYMNEIEAVQSAAKQKFIKKIFE